MRIGRLFLLIALLAPVTSLQAQQPVDPPAPSPASAKSPAPNKTVPLAKTPAPTAKPADDKEDVAAYEISNKVKTGDVGLFMPDARWKKIKTGLPKMGIGTWVEYAVSHPHFNLGTMRFSVVPQDGLPSPRWRILEMRSTDGTGDKTYIKVAFAKPSTDLRNARGMIFKAAGMPPLVLPLGKNQDENDDAFSVHIDSSPTQSAKVVYRGKVKVEVPAGTFETWHYTFSGTRPDGVKYDSDIWFDTVGIVPVMRVVKARQKDTIIELTASGKGAKSDLPYLHVGSP